MSGLKYLLDTNFILGIFKDHPIVLDTLQSQNITPPTCGYSFITRMELLAFPHITPEEKKKITTLLYQMTYLDLGWSRAIEDATIALKQKTKLKLPDAIILATAKVHELELLTLDKALLQASDFS